MDSTFHPIRLALNKEELFRPDTEEVIPFDSYETGELRFGIADPDHEDYDSLADYFYSEETGILEIRIPWMLLNAREPSKKEFIGDLRENGNEASMTIEGIDIVVNVLDEEEKLADGFESESIARYTWENWDLPKYEERLKQSYYILQAAFE
ncbi:hypothetical protein [Salipaludibacillus neizhouensis]|uniref:hypothetical protein n=1 Tax=Salipaludibacillus neizhouensis TaxID=885475 RepID=UPI001CBA6206|nr:hypothetical protein [Salipaludibacillus neizhouensis]